MKHPTNKNRFLIGVILLALLLGTGILAGAQSGDGYDLSWHTVDGGGGISNGGGFTLSGTIGQADAGLASGGNFSLDGGFWPGVCSLPGATAVLSNGVQFNWSGGSNQNIFRAVDDPYFSDGVQIGTNESGGWIFNEALLGNANQNGYYMVGTFVGCGDRVGEFDFMIVPGG